MHYIIYGAGGIGGTIGARLHQAGEQVTLIARGDHLQALQQNGMQFIAPDGEFNLHIPAVGSPSELAETLPDGPAVVLMCMKSQHTIQALDDLRNALGSDIPVVCTQNSVANERAALRRFANVYAQVVFLPAVHLKPGQIITHAKGAGGVLDIGRYPGSSDEICEEVARALTAGGFSAYANAEVMQLKYAKLLANLNNALIAATEMAEGSEDIGRAMRAEALACYEAAGIAWASGADFKARLTRDPVEMVDIDGHPRGGGSSWQSLKRGTGDIETDYLNGEICQLGRLHGIPTPANAAMQDLAVTMLRERIAPGSVTPQDIMKQIEARQ